MATKTRRVSGTRGAHKGKKTARKKRGPAKRPAARRSPPGKPGPVNEWFELRQSAIDGLGAFSIAPIPRGTRVIEYAGEKINNAEADRRYDDASMRAHHTFLFILTTRTCVDAAFDGNESRFINHSCDPNCETMVDRGIIWIRAIKHIAPGDELTYDYQYDDEPEYTERDYQFYGCHCGAANCRGTIVKTRRKWRP
jgi:uncharacterized protein